jgi:transposase
MPTPNKYPKEFREKAVRMVAEMNAPDAIKRVSEKLGVNRETVRYWVNNAPVSKG